MGFQGHYARELGELQKTARETRAREIETQWQQLTYADFDREEIADAFLKRIKWSSLALSDVQQRKLTKRLGALLQYFRNPTFAEYFSLKTDGLRYDLKPRPMANKDLSMRGLQQEAAEFSEPKPILNMMWNAFHTNGGTGQLPKITSVCLDSIESDTSHTNSSSSLLRGKVAKGMTVAVEASDPGVQYTSLGFSPTQPPDPDVYFHLSFFAKANGSANAGPVYVTLCWLKQEEDWGLSRLIADSWVGIKTVF